MPRLFQSKGKENRHARNEVTENGEREINGLFELWPGTTDTAARIETKLDIVAIHGLNGHPYKTWMDGDRLWLQDFLPKTIPDARIFSYGYNSRVAFTGSASKVEDYARLLLERLKGRRRDFSDPNRPIIFICHSLGGIVLKKALIIAHERSDRYQSLSKAVHGVLFMGTPHRGADLAFWASILGALANSFAPGYIRTQLLKDLRPESQCIGNICSQFVERAQSLKIFTIYERLKIKGLNKLVVNEHSAVMHLPNEVPVPLEADHHTICKFLTSSSEKFQTVFDCLRELVEDSLAIDQAYTTATRSEFLQSLKGFDPEGVLRRLPQTCQGTCSWFSKHPIFLAWRDNSIPQILWIWGAPGVGKTVMMKYLLEHLRQKFLGNRHLTVHHFCDDKKLHQNKDTHLIHSVLDQLVSQDRQLIRYLSDADMNDYLVILRQASSEAHQEDAAILWQFLFTILQRSHHHKFWIIIDAFDELGSASRKQVLGNITYISNFDLMHRVKFIFSDRVRPTSRSFEPVASVFEIESKDSAGDVRRFISMHVKELCIEEDIPRKYQAVIEDTLVGLSEGIFLHASLAWANFQAGVSNWSQRIIVERLEAVRRISRDTASYYCALLRRIPKDTEKIAKRAFIWVLGARKPLNVVELQHAIAVSSGQNSWADLENALTFNFRTKVEKFFGYLLRVAQDGYVRFTHQSVKDLLLSSPGSFSPENELVLAKFRIREDQVEAELAKASIIFLSFNNFAQNALDRGVRILEDALLIEEREAIRLGNGAQSQKSPEEKAKGYLDIDSKQLVVQKSLQTDRYQLLSYCATYWNYHCTKASSDPDVIAALSSFVFKWQSYFFFRSATLLGLFKVNDSLIWNKLSQFNRLPPPPLHFIVRLGDYPAVVLNLIRGGQDVNNLDRLGWTPLCWAVTEDRHASIEVLLSFSSTIVNRTDPKADGPLHVACMTHSSSATIKMILNDPRTDINAKSSEGWTALHLLLAKSRHLEIINSLLNRDDLDISATNQDGATLLEQCFYDGVAEDIVLKILSRPDMSAKWFLKRLGRNPIERFSLPRLVKISSYLHRASGWEWYRVEDLILSRDPSQAVKLEDGMSLIEDYAFRGVRQRLVQILGLLPHDIFRRNVLHQTSILHLCAQQDWESIVEELQDKFSLNMREADKHGRTVLHYAVEFQWQSVATLCNSTDMSWLNRQALDGKTALHIAAEHRNAPACETLLEAGCNQLIRDNRGSLAVHVAAEHGHRLILKLLLQSPIRDHGRGSEKKALLHFIAMWNSEDFIRKYITRYRPIIDIFDRLRRTPLHYAAIYRNRSAVEILLDRGANPCLKDAGGSTPLHYALIEGSVEIVELLLGHDAYLWELDGYHRNSLQLAIRGQALELIDFILGKIRLQKELRESDPRRYRSDVNLVQMIHHSDLFGQSVLHRAALLRVTRNVFLDEWHGETLEYAAQETEEMIESEDIIQSLPIKEVMHDLVALGANINAQDKYGASPLHIASKSNNRAAVDALLSLPGIQTSFKDHMGCTPLDWAEAQGQKWMSDDLYLGGAMHSEGWKTKLCFTYVRGEDIDEQRYIPNEWALTLRT